MCDTNTTNENQENIANQDSGSGSGFFQMHQNMINNADGYFVEGSGPGSTLSTGFPEVLPQWNFPQAFNPAHFSARDPDPFLIPPMFNPRRAPFGYEPGSASDHHHLRLLTESLAQHPMGSGPFGLHAELQKMTAQEVMDAKALAASKSHSEAERRRRERINNHMAKLRSLLPSTTKTDKASLLAEVIQHVKELKRQTSLIAETSPVPTETDELTVDASSDEIGRPLLKASICCEDRPELLPDLIKTLKELRLKTLKAEITTLGGRVKNVLYVTADDECGEIGDQQQFCIGSIEEALKSVMERANAEDSSSGGVKRQRTNVSIIEHRSV